jgi:basic membrane protein A and related proteins
MRARTRLKLLAMMSLLALSAAACGGGDPAETGGGGGGDGAGIKVGIALDVGGLGDQGFNDAANQALQQAITDGLVAEEDTELLEPNQSGSNRDSNVVNLADQGYDLILANGFAFSVGINEIAADYPDVNFGIIDGFATCGDPCGIPELATDNVTDLTFKEHEGSYLVGAAAAMKSKAGTIGFLGGQSGTGLIEKFEAGYIAGAEAIDPGIEVLVEYIGDTTQAFNDITKGKALSEGMYDDGADVIYHAAGKSGLGLFDASVDAGKLSIGVDLDQSLTASPEQRALILTSMIKRVDTAVYDTIAAVADGNFVSGFQAFGLAEEGIDYAVNEFNDTDELLSADIQAQLDEFKAQIISGEIEVPEEP